jgi:hypothetical protein
VTTPTLGDETAMLLGTLENQRNHGTPTRSEAYLATPGDPDTGPGGPIGAEGTPFYSLASSRSGGSTGG